MNELEGLGYDDLIDNIDEFIDEWFEVHEATKEYYMPLNTIESKFKLAWNEMRNGYILDDRHIFDQTFIHSLEDRIFAVFASHYIPTDDELVKSCYKIDMDQNGYDIMQADDVLELLAIRNDKLVRRVDL